MQGPGRTDTVLVIDDEPDTLRMLTAVLEAAEISVLVATSGQGALDLLGHIIPDLILIDAVMPGLDGFETTVRIKANPAWAGVPVIFMTGLTESEHVVEAFEVGGTDYVRKPVNHSELLARLRVHMAQGRAMHASVASLDATGRQMVATDRNGNLLWCTPGAEQVIDRVAGGWNRAAGALPAALRDPVGNLLARPDLSGATTRIDLRGAGSLELVVVAQYRENEVLIRLNELNPERDVLRLGERLGLTQRESEVLLWVSYGKASSDISLVLEISPRTVQKHLERIYEKLGVETRSAAAAIAIRAIGQ
ncbi:response regulator [Novosphingobium flavum]|uniref:Response regulator n=1 Tax=Novosphingobium flavum TaxID=1778672 RepID=A0A7X1FTS7_9SPHN|nr:response regulator [Novosphingobium flavum]MBC2666850.1 response regulator [Novosphingobium flavum]